MIRQWIMFFMAMSDGIVSKKVKGYRKITILMTIDPFKWRQNQTWLSKSQIYDINAFHNSLELIWCIMLGFRPFIWNLYGHFQIVSPERTRPKHSLKKFQFCSPAFWPLLLTKALCSDKWSDFQIIVVFLYNSASFPTSNLVLSLLLLKLWKKVLHIYGDHPV